MGRKQKERQKKKNNQKLLAAATATETATATATVTATTASSGEAVGVWNNSATAGRSSRVDVDVGFGVAAAKKRTTTKPTTMATCYHGTTAENFAKGSHFRMVVDEWLTIVMNLTGKNHTELIIAISNFRVKHKELTNNPEFNQCVFAVGTDIFKKSYGSEEYSSSLKHKLQGVLRLGINTKYLHCCLVADKEKFDKYNRDTTTDRDIINVLFRETNTFCNCMKPYKEEAKAMEKLGMCDNCHNEFPKEKLRLCSRCIAVQYCSNKCMKKNWPTHRQFCTPHNEQKSEE